MIFCISAVMVTGSETANFTRRKKNGLARELLALVDDLFSKDFLAPVLLSGMI